MRVILLGPPGSGRRILAKKLASHFSLTYLNLGDLLGKISKEDSELGRLVGELVAACAPLPEELVSSVLKAALADEKARENFILDDYPREQGHADILNNILGSLGIPIELVIAMQVDADDLMERLVGKLTCEACGTEYNIYTNPPMVDGVCDACGGRIARRPGDYEETISNRLRVYEAQAAQLVARYKETGLLHIVPGTGDEARVFSTCVRIVDEASRKRASIEERVEAAGSQTGKKKASAKGKAAGAREQQSPAKAVAKKKKTAKKAAVTTPEEKKAPESRAPTKKAAEKTAVPKKSASKKAPTKTVPAKKVPVKKTMTKGGVPKKAVVKQGVPKKAAPKKTTVKKTMATKASARKPAASKSAKKAASTQKTTVKKAAVPKTAAKKTNTKKVVAKKTTAATKKKPAASKKTAVPVKKKAAVKKRGR